MKIIISEFEKSEIKKMYGLLNEQVQIPTIVNGTYTASNCDELHAFQSTGGKVIGNMNVIVGNKLDELYKLGFNPKPVKVSVQVNDLTVNWSVTIDKSNDGMAWVGFTSRGAGCNNDIIDRAKSSSVGNDIQSAKEKIMSTFGETNIEIEEINDFIYRHPKNGFRQIFYRYTKPQKFPYIGGSVSQTKQTNVSKNVGGYRLNGSVELQKNAFNELSKRLQDWTKEESEDGRTFTVGNFELSLSNDGKKIQFTIVGNPKGQKYTKLVLAINNEAKRAQESKGYSLIKSGKIQLPDEFASSNPDGYSWYLFGEPSK